MFKIAIGASLLAASQSAQPAYRQAESAAWPSREKGQIVRYHGVLIRVPDLQKAREFYVGILGFREEIVSPTMVRLGDKSLIYLEQVDHALRPPAIDEARAAVAFKVKDIAAAYRRLRERGVDFLNYQLLPVGVGMSIRFRDPFGNIHALLQQTRGPVEEFEEPAVYNSGLKQPDADTEALRSLFGTLGIAAVNLSYYPPSLPLRHQDGTFAFMLHENEPSEPEIKSRSDSAGAAVSLILSSKDLRVTKRLLPGQKMGQNQVFVLGCRARWIVPSNLPVELWELGSDSKACAVPGDEKLPPADRH